MCWYALGVCFCSAPGGNDQAGSGVGWVLYPPLSVNEGGMSMDLAIFAVHVSGASSILGAINMITTFLNMRAPGMTLFKVPLFAGRSSSRLVDPAVPARSGGRDHHAC